METGSVDLLWPLCVQPTRGHLLLLLSEGRPQVFDLEGDVPRTEPGDLHGPCHLHEGLIPEDAVLVRRKGTIPETLFVSVENHEFGHLRVGQTEAKGHYGLIHGGGGKCYPGPRPVLDWGVEKARGGGTAAHRPSVELYTTR